MCDSKDLPTDCGTASLMNSGSMFLVSILSLWKNGNKKTVDVYNSLLWPKNHNIWNTNRNTTHSSVSSPGGGYSTLSWVRMCGPKFRPPPYNKTREDANLLPISKPFVSWRAIFKTNQCFLQCKLGCISTFWQPIDKPKDKFIGNYAFCKNATYIKTNFQIKKGPLQNLRARKSTLSGPHIPVPTFPLSTPPPGIKA